MRIHKIKHLTKMVICLTCKTKQEVHECIVEKPACDVCGDTNFENLDYYNEMQTKSNNEIE